MNDTSLSFDEGQEVSCLANRLWVTLALLLITHELYESYCFYCTSIERINERTMSREIIQTLEKSHSKSRTLNSSAYLWNAYRAYASHTGAQSKHVQKRSKHVSMPHTPYPAAIHACSCTLTQKSWYSVSPSASSRCGASAAPYMPPVTAPASEAGSSGSDHTLGLDGAGRSCAR